MKVFKFDPATGKRGDLIDNIKLASWTSYHVAHGVKTGANQPIPCTLPSVKGQEWTVHVDAGASDAQTGEDISYLRDEWICFCLGEWGTQYERMWTWVVLPPKSAIVSPEAA